MFDRLLHRCNSNRLRMWLKRDGDGVEDRCLREVRVPMYCIWGDYTNEWGKCRLFLDMLFIFYLWQLSLLFQSSSVHLSQVLNWGYYRLEILVNCRVFD